MAAQSDHQGNCYLSEQFKINPESLVILNVVPTIMCSDQQMAEHISLSRTTGAVAAQGGMNLCTVNVGIFKESLSA